MILEIPLRPFPAVRSNKNSSWTEKTQAYHAKMNNLRFYVHPHKKEIIESLIEGTYRIEFHFAMADSWSKKKRLEMDGKPMQSRPDTDNLFKAFTDTVFWKDKEHDDSEIWNNCYSKHWGKEDKIVFIAD